MQQYLTRRFILFFPTLLLASIAIFAAMHMLPGDVALVILGGESNDASALQQLESIRNELGLNEPLIVQYGNWLWTMINGEFGGRSLIDKEELSSIIGRRLPVTVQLTLLSIIIGVVLSVPLGIMAAVHQDRWPDYLIRILTIAGHAIPNFWLALVLLLVMVVFFSWSPPVFYKAMWDDPSSHFQQTIWPALLLAWGFSGIMTRVTRSNMLEVLRQDYIRTARSKGLRERNVLWRHALRNALIPVITLAGLQLAGLLSGTIILETIFGLPGLGQGMVLAASARDYPVVQSLAMLLVLMMLGLNLVIDVFYVFIDPRITYS